MILTNQSVQIDCSRDDRKRSFQEKNNKIYTSTSRPNLTVPNPEVRMAVAGHPEGLSLAHRLRRYVRVGEPNAVHDKHAGDVLRTRERSAHPWAEALQGSAFSRQPMRVEQNFICQLCTAGYDRCETVVYCGCMGPIFRHCTRYCVACCKYARLRGGTIPMVVCYSRRKSRLATGVKTHFGEM